MKPIKTAIIGTGFMGRVHLEAVQRVENVEAAGIAAGQSLAGLLYRVRLAAESHGRRGAGAGRQ